MPRPEVQITPLLKIGQDGAQGEDIKIATKLENLQRAEK